MSKRESGKSFGMNVSLSFEFWECEEVVEKEVMFLKALWFDYGHKEKDISSVVILWKAMF